MNVESRVNEVVDKVLKVYSKYIDEYLDIYGGNRYLLSVIESLIHECKAGLLDPSELQKIAIELREKILEGPGNMNPYIMEILGILEESTEENNLREALEIAKRLWKEDRFEKLEV